ncbi:MAG: uncharacterized protein A8A55_2529 [Amphiamblys sp. WSBS2006]|nr:MAG: uncharacterized protein A8A55_2529 [Amphiamblys sp. WSBS2006]
MRASIVKVLRRVWDEGIPEKEWELAEVVTIPKKGDPEQVDNYRGISLLPVGLKMICTIAARRLNEYMEQNDILDERQAGFRRGEECLGHVAYLVETIQERAREKKTYACFIDFRKAYDRVPHEALLRKLQTETGMDGDGRLMKFVRAIYRAPRLTIRADGVKNECELEVGLRQGCPLSPTLFNVFINDVLEGLGEGAIENRGAGLAFADDLVVLGATKEILRKAVVQIELWAGRWEMEINPKKCGVMVFGGDQGEKVGVTTRGGTIPEPDSYTYLGVELDRNLSRKTMSERRRKKGLECLLMLEKNLRSPSLSIGHKTLLVKGILMPTMLYGAEVYGSIGKTTSGAQVVVNKALGMIAGNGGVLTAVRRDLGVIPIQAAAASRQRRAWLKFPTLRTVGSRVATKDKHLPYGWSGRTNREVKRRPDKNSMWEMLEDKDGTGAWKSYREFGLYHSREQFRWLASTKPDVRRGWKKVLQLRTGGLWAGLFAARIGIPKEELLVWCRLHRIRSGS